MSSTQPIGIFDSGVGGLTVAKAVNQLLPNESLVYFGDTAHLPYGEKSNEAIIEYSLKIADYLVHQKQAKAILMACNSASAVAYYPLKERFSGIVPIINVIDSVAQHVAEHFGKSKVGVIGTRATTSSKSYPDKINRHNDKVEVMPLATPLLVPIIEEGLSESNISLEAIKHYLGHPTLSSIDALVLGCTHYPLIIDEITAYYQNGVKVIDSPAIVARRVKEVLESKDLLNKEDHQVSYNFYVSDFTPVFEKIAQYIFKNIQLREENIWK